MSVQEVSGDLAIIGGGVGGVAAALAACRRGLTVVLTEQSDWLGGQLTNQAVPPDEHPWIEQFGSTAAYRRFRNGVREYYRTWYPLTEQARQQEHLNPGEASVSGLAHEPRVALAVIEGMLAPYVASGLLRVLLEHRPTAVATEGDRVTAVTLRSASDAEVTVVASYVIDATESGELLALGGIEHVTGAESQRQTGERHAPAIAQPDNVQAFSWCFAFDHVAGADHVIDRPAQYDRWRAYDPDIWTGPMLGLVAPNPRTLEPKPRVFVPNHQQDGRVVADQSKDAGDTDLWVFRRILSRRNFVPGAFTSDVVLANWPMMDYWEGSAFGGTPEQDAANLQGARQLSLSLFYWLQTEAPRPDGGTGWGGLRLRGDITGTADGLAKMPYLRESRRIRAQYTVVEQDLSVEERGDRGAVRYRDSVGVGSYRIDLHPSTGGDTYIDIASNPYQIPLGALVPERVRNLIPGAKNIGTTHITNGCYRLHPTEWNIGEVAGELVAFCLASGTEPTGVTGDERVLAQFQSVLDAAGVERDWPRVGGY